DGNLYVASQSGGGILRYDGQTGQFIDTFIQPGESGPLYAYALTFGPDGNLYVGSAGGSLAGILPYNGHTGPPIPAPGNSGAVFIPLLGYGSDLLNTMSLAFGPNGNLYVSNFYQSLEGALYGDILRFNGQTGQFMGTFISEVPGQLNIPRTLRFEGEYLYI